MAERRDISDDLDNVLDATRSNDTSVLQRDPYLFSSGRKSTSNIELSTLHRKWQTIKRSQSFPSQIQQNGIVDETDSGPGVTIYDRAFAGQRSFSKIADDSAIQINQVTDTKGIKQCNFVIETDDVLTAEAVDSRWQTANLVSENLAGTENFDTECRVATNQTPGLNEALYDRGVAELKTSTDSIITAETEQSKPGSNEALNVSGNQYGHDLDQSLSLKSSESLDLQQHTLNDIDHGKKSETSGQVVMDKSGHTNGTVDATFQLTKEVDMRAKLRSSQKQMKTTSSRKQLTRKQTTIEQPATTKRKTQAASSSVSSPARMAKTTSATTSETKDTEKMGSGTRGTTEQQPKEDVADTMFPGKKEGESTKSIQSDKSTAVTTRPTKNLSGELSCSAIKELSPDIIHVWEGYKSEETDYERQNLGRIFVVVLKRKIENLSEKILEMGLSRTIQRLPDEVSDEREQPLQKEANLAFSLEEHNKMRATLLRYSGNWMKSHSNLEIVSASKIKSKNSGETKKTEPCVVFYVHVKGIIPVNEEPFPKTVGEWEFPVHVREGTFVNYSDPRLAIGSIIGANGNCLKIAGFVNLPSGNIGCLTCSHIFQTHKSMEVDNGEPAREDVYQFPFSQNSTPFGKVYRNIYDPGYSKTETDFKIGIDAALIEITDRLRNPIDGNYKHSVMHSAACDITMDYYSGEILTSLEEVARLHITENMKCKIVRYNENQRKLYTRTGIIRSDVASLRLNAWWPTKSNEPCQMYAQIHIDPDRENIEDREDESFATWGDCGSLVFLMSETGEHMWAFGMVVGGIPNEGSAIVTPIWAVLDALGLPRKFMSFKYLGKQLKDVVNEVKDLGRNVEGLDRKVEGLDQKVESLDRKVEGIDRKMDEQFKQLMIELKKRNVDSDRNESNSNPGDQMQSSANSETQQCTEREVCAKELGSQQTDNSRTENT